jgi:hypothetical protein
MFQQRAKLLKKLSKHLTKNWNENLIFF